jgi:hypothetical protein
LLREFGERIDVELAEHHLALDICRWGIRDQAVVPAEGNAGRYH